MDIAKCILDGIRYDITSFCLLGSEKLDRLRKGLICDKCSGKGYFRKKSRDGKPACFGAYHLDGCDLKAKDSLSQHDPEVIEEVNVITTNNQVIDIAFSRYTASQIEPKNPPKVLFSNKSTSGTSKYHSKKPEQIRNVSKGLHSLLRMLTYSDSFSTSDVEINTGGKHPFKAKNLFINFDQIEEKHIGMWRGFWGVISHSDKDIQWLNTANRQDVSIPILEARDYLTDVFGVQSSEDLAGALVLIFGWLKVSKSDAKKWYIKTATGQHPHIFVKIAP